MVGRIRKLDVEDVMELSFCVEIICKNEVIEILHEE